MALRILFVAALHHPEALRAAIANTPPGTPPPLFPPSVSQHFWERALRRRGHTLDVFYRNLPPDGRGRAQRHRSGLTAGKILAGLAARLPPQANPEYRRRNAALKQRALVFRPDILWLVGDNTVIYPQTLAAIKDATGCALIYASGTSPIVFSRPVERQAAPLYDLVLVNDYYHGIQWLELGAQQMACLPLSACDPDFHRPYDLTPQERAAYSCDIAFVGTLLPDSLYSSRVRALEALADFDLGIWSVHEVPPSLRRFARGSALGETMLRALSAAKITVNPHGNFMRYGGNMRLFEAAGVGTLQLTDDLPGVRQWFSPGETIVTYSDPADLRDKARYYLAHDEARTALAAAARQHVYAYHTYDQRVMAFERLLSDALKR
ncbi:MAG: CgeB family protein [Aggregatilineales bacterium]